MRNILNDSASLDGAVIPSSSRDPVHKWFLTFVRMTYLAFAALLLTGCSTPPEPVDSLPPLTVNNLKTTVVAAHKKVCSLHADTAQLSHDQTMVAGNAVAVQLTAKDGPSITITAPYAEWHTDSKKLVTTGTVTTSHDAGWLQARGATCDMEKQTFFLKGPVESVIKL